MNHTPIINKLTELGYKGFKEAYLHQIEDVNYDSMSFNERLYQLLDAQDISLANKRIIMNHRLSKSKINKQLLMQSIMMPEEKSIKRKYSL